MKADFLPKDLDGIGSRKYVINIQHGCSHTEMHWHDCIEIIFVERGSIKVFLNNKWHTLSTGNMVFFPPHRIHCVHCDNENTVKTVIGFSKELICDSNTDEEYMILPFDTNLITEHCFFDDSHFGEIVKNLHNTESAYCDRLILQAEILKLYANIYKEWQRKGLVFTEPVKDKNIYTIISILQKEYGCAPTSYDMAKHLNMSYSNMARLLNEKLGTSYNTLLNHIKIENSKKLLVASDKSITEICFDCGFQSTSYFIKTFKNLVGTTPHQYRVMNQYTDGSFNLKK